MARTRRFPALPGLVIGVILSTAEVRAQDTVAGGSVAEAPLPGGLARALAVTGDLASADRSQFLIEFIRRTHDLPIVTGSDRRTEVIRAVADAMSQPSPDGNAGRETLPLPLGTAVWLTNVFGGRESPQTVLGAIVRSRSASLLYYGLLSLDDATRAWIATEPDLIAALASKHSASFVIAASGLRVSNGSLRVPGGEAAEPIWEALVGRPVREKAAFVRALVEANRGSLAYFYTAMAELSGPHIKYALWLDMRDTGARVSNAKRLYSVFESVVDGWKPDEQPFSRPPVDPALLLGEVGLDGEGALALPGTRRFWSAVFDSTDAWTDQEARELAEGHPPDFLWLCEQVYTAKPLEQRRRHLTVLFAARVARTITITNARDAVEAVRSVGKYPVLAASLERARLQDLSSFAHVARRAAQITALRDGARTVRAMAGFQGLLFVLTRSAIRGGLSPESLAAALSSLAGVEIDRRGEYNTALVRWLDSYLRERAAVSGAGTATTDAASMSLEAGVLTLMTGPSPASSQLLEWEGTRYRVDVSRADAIRIGRLLGDHPRPYLTAARRLVEMSDALGKPSLNADEIGRQAAALAEVGRDLRLDAQDPGPAAFYPSLGDKSLVDRYREIEQAVRRTNRGDSERLRQSVVTLAGDLFARGLIEMVYAAALGRSERSGLAIDAGDAAIRHNLGLRASGLAEVGPWEQAVTGSELGQGWHTEGSLLGLDVTLADFSLVSLSSKPPARKPMMAEGDRRLLIETVVLVQPAALTDSGRDAIAAGIGRGRERLAAVRTAADAAALAARIPIDGPRQSLLPWVAAHDPARLPAFLSPLELLWLGLDEGAIPGLDAWGSPGQARFGCLCLRFPDRRPGAAFAGRTRTGAMASTFPDLNLRLTELLAEMKMPAALLAGVLNSATRDFLDNAVSRDDNDRRGPVEFVQALRAERVEQYLLFLTTDGPLVPMDGASHGGGR